MHVDNVIGPKEIKPRELFDADVDLAQQVLAILRGHFVFQLYSEARAKFIYRKTV